MCRGGQTYRRSYVTEEIFKLKRGPKTKFLTKVLRQFEHMAYAQQQLWDQYKGKPGRHARHWLGDEGRLYADRKALSNQYRRKLRSKQRRPQHNSSTTKALQRLKKKSTNKY